MFAVILYLVAVLCAIAGITRARKSLQRDETMNGWSFRGYLPRMFPPRIWLAWVLFFVAVVVTMYADAYTSATFDSGVLPSAATLVAETLDIVLGMMLLARPANWVWHKVVSILTD